MKPIQSESRGQGRGFSCSSPDCTVEYGLRHLSRFLHQIVCLTVESSKHRLVLVDRWDHTSVPVMVRAERNDIPIRCSLCRPYLLARMVKLRWSTWISVYHAGNAPDASDNTHVLLVGNVLYPLTHAPFQGSGAGLGQRIPSTRAQAL